MLAAAIGASEERILAIEGGGPDGALDDVGIDLDPAVIKEANEAAPAAEVNKASLIAVDSDGSRVLGIADFAPEGGLPVIEDNCSL